MNKVRFWRSRPFLKEEPWELDCIFSVSRRSIPLHSRSTECWPHLSSLKCESSIYWQSSFLQSSSRSWWRITSTCKEMFEGHFDNQTRKGQIQYWVTPKDEWGSVLIEQKRRPVIRMRCDNRILKSMLTLKKVIFFLMMIKSLWVSELFNPQQRRLSIRDLKSVKKSSSCLRKFTGRFCLRLHWQQKQHMSDGSLDRQ